MLLGAGRARVDSKIDPSVGVILHKKVGDRVEAGEPLCTVLVNDEPGIEVALAMIGEAYRIEGRAGHARTPDRGTDLIEGRESRNGKAESACEGCPLGIIVAAFASGSSSRRSFWASRRSVSSPGPKSLWASGHLRSFRSVRLAILQSVVGIRRDPGAGLCDVEPPQGDLPKRVVIWGLLLQWVFALIVLREPARAPGPGEGRGTSSKAVLDCALVGSERFVFGEKLVAPDGPAGFVFAFRVLPTVIFVAALFAVLYHLGVMQWVVRLLAIGMEKLMGASGAESLNVAASLFLGQTEAPLTIRPYLPKLTRRSCSR